MPTPLPSYYAWLAQANAALELNPDDLELKWMFGLILQEVKKEEVTLLLAGVMTTRVQ